MFSIKSLTEKNKGRKNKPNQDHFSSWFKDGLNNPHGFLGVYDGHGNYGHYVSEIIRDYFALNIPEQWEELNNDFYTTINTLFYNAQSVLYDKIIIKLNSLGFETREIDLESNYKNIEYNNRFGWKLFMSGTTCSLVIILENNILYHVHLGDSECVIFDKDEHKTVYQKKLTKDHSPSSIEEYKRVTQNYKKPGLFKYNLISNGLNTIGPNIFNHDKDENIIKENPYKLYKTYNKMYIKNVEKEFSTYFTNPINKSMSLSVLRSFGDFHLTPFGISYIPDIIEHRFTENTIILLASDGLWDNWVKEDLLNQFQIWLNQGMSFIDIYTLLWNITDVDATKNFGSSRDDITMILFSKTF